jgi:hypothetical protein
VVAIWPENAEAFDLFVSLETQWRLLAGFGAVGYIGLDYAAVRGELRARGIKDRARVFEDLRVMERAALPILNQHDDGDV